MDKKAHYCFFPSREETNSLYSGLKSLRNEFNEGFKSLIKQADEILKEIGEMRAYAERRLEELP